MAEATTGRAYVRRHELAQSEARLEARVEAHEAVCAERMKRIDERLANGDAARERIRREMAGGFAGVHARLWCAAGAVIALEAAAIGWFASTSGLAGGG